MVTVVGFEDNSKINNKVISDERIKHCHGVAELMYKNYEAFGCGYLTKNQVYLLGLTHDIGYIEGKHQHEDTGAEVFAAICDEERQEIPFMIAWHSDSPQQFIKECDMTLNEIPRELILLWWADKMVESTGAEAGNIVGLEKRLSNFTERLSVIGEVSYKDDEMTTEKVKELENLKDGIKWLEEKLPELDITPIVS